MFSAVPMMRVSAMVLERDARAVLRGLGRAGMVHIARTRAGPEAAPLAPPDRSAERARCAGLCARIAELRRQFDLPHAEGPANEPQPLTLDQLDAALQAVEGRAAEANRRCEDLRQRRGQVAKLIEQVSAFQGLDVPFGPAERSSFLHFAIGSLPDVRLDALRAQVGPQVVLLPVPRGPGRSALVAITSRTGRFALETSLQQAGFRAEDVPVAGGATADAVVTEARREQARLEAAAAEAEQARRDLAASIAAPLAEMEQMAVAERCLLEADEQFSRTDTTVLITGWVPAADVPALVRQVRELTHGVCAIEAFPPDRVAEDQVPVLLRHPRVLRPFEMLVAGYGLPGYRELEPTLFVAITYVLMFGMMFGDAGHGAVLSLGGLVALITGRSQRVRDTGVLILLAGLSSIAFGVVYGSYFGLTSLRRHALWHDPLAGDPMALMRMAVGLGVGIISLGLVLNIVNRFRKRDWVGGFLDRFGVVGAVFYWGVLTLLLKYAALQRRGLVALVATLVVVLPVAAWALREPLAYALSRRAHRQPRTGGVFEAALESTVEAFEAVLGYMANTISFVRLAAYAMSHAAVLMATFVMAAEVQKVPVGGGVLSVLVIVAGNLVAILLEGTIAAVQALRLEYYEFFGKFFSGRGQAFTPFRLHAAKD